LAGNCGRIPVTDKALQQDRFVEKHPFNIRTASAWQHGLIWQYPAQTSGRRLLLLHGAGIAGELTWTYVANYLEGWSEILVPDFAGMGKSSFLDEAAPSIEHYARQIRELLHALDWQAMDIAGYSFGGSVTETLIRDAGHFNLCYLLEPATLSGDDEDGLLEKASLYLRLADWLSREPDASEPYLAFLDAVSPKRRRNAAADRIAISRLRGNVQGMVQALNAVNNNLLANSRYFADWCAPLPGMSMVGELSMPAMHQRQARLERESDQWFTQMITGADHSLVFTHPKQVARLMNERLQMELGIEPEVE
jgi:pimeloyl-ACP methyl ester carboxylesterase